MGSNPFRTSILICMHLYFHIYYLCLWKINKWKLIIKKMNLKTLSESEQKIMPFTYVCSSWTTVTKECVLVLAIWTAKIAQGKVIKCYWCRESLLWYSDIRSGYFIAKISQSKLLVFFNIVWHSFGINIKNTKREKLSWVIKEWWHRFG